jgi:hypothetical protein
VAGGVTTASDSSTPDTYKDRLLKYIPAAVVAVYLTLLNLLEGGGCSPSTTAVEWVVFGVLLIASVPWQRRILHITKWQQEAIGSAAFVFWALSLGNPFNSALPGRYEPRFGTVLMALYTSLIPLFEAD